MVKYKIAINGKAKSGKNTVANFVLNNIRKRSSIVAFADPIKEIILKMFPDKADRECLFGSSEKRSEIINGALNLNNEPLTYRQLLIDIGTLGRKYNQNIWIDALKCDFEIKENCVDTYVVSDLRYYNEFLFLKEKGFFLIRVKRDDITKINHISENDLNNIKDSEFDAVIENNGSLESLENKVKSIVNQLKLINK